MENLLKNYDISVNGFLPENPPLEKLPDDYAELDVIAYNLATLNKKGEIRETIDNLSVYDMSKLSTLQEFQRAYSILSLIAHSYIWASGYDTVPSILPEAISKPWWQVSKKLGINCILTHAAVDLYNWKLIDPKGKITVDNMRCIHTMTGNFDEEWFYLTMTHIEKIGGVILKEIVNIWLNSNNPDVITKSLQIIKKKISKIAKVTARTKEKCDPYIFYHVLRPYLGGWKDNDALPNGLLYEGVSDDYIKFVGGSAAQSSLISSLDAAFQITHEDVYFEKIKDYMPQKHKEFIDLVRSDINIKQYIENETFDKNQIDVMQTLYSECIGELYKFRQVHYKLVENYIIKMKKNACTDDSGMKKNASTDDSEIKGTGGTDLGKFLNASMKETLDKKKIKTTVNQSVSFS